MKKYVAEDKQKNRSLNKSVGRGALLQHGNQHFLDDVLVQKYRVNDGAYPKYSIDVVQQLDPHINRTHSCCHLQFKVIPNFKQQLKKKSIIYQATKTKRTGITVFQQLRWYNTYEVTLN